jgi:hypothetical protein
LDASFVIFFKFVANFHMMKLEDEKKIIRKTSEDEIDLVKVANNLFKSIVNLFKYIFRFCFSLLDNIYKNLKLIGGLVILGGLLGLSFFYANKPYYESSMTLSSDYFKGELLDNSISNLNDVCREGNIKVLASLLKISPKKAQQIRSIKINPVISQNFRMLIDLYSKDEKYKGKLDSLLIYNNQSTFQLYVEVYDTSVFKGLDTILVNYIKSNDFVKKRIEVDRANLNNLRDKLARESSKLDTLKRSIASSIKSSGDAGRSGTNNVILGEKSVNPIDIYREDLQIYNQRQEIERQLALNAEIEVIEKFIPYSSPKSGSGITNTAKGAIGGLIIGLLYIIYQILREALTRLRYSLLEEQTT